MDTSHYWSNLVSVLTVIGSLGLFIFGMKIMSEGIQKAAGKKLRQILGAMTRNRFFGVFTGFFITGLIQSSSATTVMTVSFVNAGLLTLVESAGVMMGANIGTTVTGWIVSYLGFKFKVSAIAIPLMAFALPMIFMRRAVVRSWGEFLMGFAILFLGLAALKDSVPDLKESPEVLRFLSAYADPSLLSRLMFVGVGALLTIIVQSSSAAMTLTFVMTANGWIPFEVAASMILGENIGTTITAELASMVGNVHAKRSARIHSLFNIIGVAWMVVLIPHALKLITWFSVDVMGNASPYAGSTASPEAIPLALSYFHTFFNMANMFLLIGFVGPLVKTAIWSVPSRTDEDEEFHLEHIGSGVVNTPELSVIEASREVARFGKLVSKMNRMVTRLITETDLKARTKLYKKIRKYEEITDRVEVEVANFLTKVSQGELSEGLSIRIRGMLSEINDMERIADIYFQMSMVIRRKEEEQLWFTPEQRQDLLGMFELLEKALHVMCKNLDVEDKMYFDEAFELEQLINKRRDELREAHLKSIETGDYNVRSGLVYSDLFSSCEKVGDHVINVSEAADGFAYRT
ncbi:MAG: Na/Pi cotransporter family protein [Flavobacteriales bacterium]|nr:Na/Pi cotransporter family protein [Flavobacteriales bacterium]